MITYISTTTERRFSLPAQAGGSAQIIYARRPQS